MRSRRCPLILLFFIALLCAGSATARGQGATETPTPSETPTITPTASITPTPNLYWLTTLDPGQPGGIYYVVTVGQAAIAAQLLFLSVICLFGLFLMLRRRG